MSAPSTQDRQSVDRPDRLAEIGRQLCGECVAAFRPARMHADLVEVEEMVEQPHVPVGGAARPDMAEDARTLPRQMLGADRRHRAGAHVGDDGGVEDGARHAGARIEQIEDAEFRRQAVQVVVDIVADDLDAGRVERRDVAAQHVEMAAEGRIRLQMHARLDHRLAVALRDEAGLDRRQDFGVGHRQGVDVERVQIVDVDGCHARPKSFAGAEGHSTMGKPRCGATALSLAHKRRKAPAGGLTGVLFRCW